MCHSSSVSRPKNYYSSQNLSSESRARTIPLRHVMIRWAIQQIPDSVTNQVRGVLAAVKAPIFKYFAYKQENTRQMAFIGASIPLRGTSSPVGRSSTYRLPPCSVAGHTGDRNFQPSGKMRWLRIPPWNTISRGTRHWQCLAFASGRNASNLSFLFVVSAIEGFLATKVVQVSE
jgi:hypothetical protein